MAHVQIQVTSVCVLFYAGLIAVCNDPEVWFAKEGERYEDGRLLRQIYVEKAFPVEHHCFKIWTVNGLDYWLQFDPERANCKSDLERNPALASFVALLALHKVRLRIVAPGTKLAGDSHIPVELGRGPYYTPSASFEMNDKWMIYLLRPAHGFGFLPADLMNDGKASEIDGGIILVHEVGHRRNDPAPGVEGDPSNYWAVHIENQLRKQRDPNAAQRHQHDRPSPHAVPGVVQQGIQNGKPAATPQSRLTPASRGDLKINSYAAGGLEMEARDLRADMDDFSVFQPGLAQCFEVRALPAKGTLQVFFRRELIECLTYVRRNPFLAPVVEELDYVQFRLENARFPISTTGGPVVYLGRVQDGDSPAATLPEGMIVLLKRRYDAGYFCQTTYSSFPVRVHWGAVIMHEIAHARYIRSWLRHHTFWGLSLPIQNGDIPVFRAQSNQEAVAAENAWWRAGKTGIRRMYHDQALGCYAPLGT